MRAGPAVLLPPETPLQQTSLPWEGLEGWSVLVRAPSSVSLLGFWDSLTEEVLTVACHQGSARGHLINRLCLLVLIAIYMPQIPYIAMG